MYQKKEKKEYSRSVRMTPTVRKYIEKQSGNGFNQQFENIVLYCMEKDEKLKRSIAEKEKRLKVLNQQIEESESILEDIDRMRYQVESVIRNAKNLIEK